MRAYRPSIAALMMLVLAAAVGFAALNRASRLWAAVLLTGVTLAYTVAIFAAVYSAGPRRAFWSGFAAGGWLYLMLQYGPWCENQVGPYTLPTAMLDVLYSALNGSQTAAAVVSVSTGVPYPLQVNTLAGLSPTGGSPSAISGGGAATRLALSKYLTVSLASPAQGSPGTTSAWTAWTQEDRGNWPGTATTQAFYRAGHGLFSLLAACLVGIVARGLERRRAKALEALLEAPPAQVPPAKDSIPGGSIA